MSPISANPGLEEPACIEARRRADHHRRPVIELHPPPPLGTKLRAKDLREPEDRGPDYFTVRRSRFGPALLAVVRRALQGDALTHTKAAKILGVRPSSVDALLRDRPRAA